MARVLLLLPTFIFAAYSVRELNRDWMPDLFIYRTGASLGWQGESPYSVKIRDAVRVQWPEDAKLIDNCGYFLPPLTIVLGGPFALVPWPTAKLLYSILALGSFIACWYGLAYVFRNRPPPKLDDIPLLLPWLLVLHPVLRMTFDVGQTTILAAGAIVLGQMAHEKGWKILGTLLWACAFVKPHIALPLIPLAFALSGWKRAAWLVAWLAVLNLLGCLLAGGSPMFALDYLRGLGDAHQAVTFNRVELNPQITSWNRVLISVGGPVIELGAIGTLAGYAVFFSLIVLRCAIARKRPTDAWLVAIAMTAAMVCCQVMAYEAWLLVLVVPHLLDCFEKKKYVDFALVVMLLMSQIYNLDGMNEAGWKLDQFLGLDFVFAPVFFSFRPWFIFLLALVLLALPAWRSVDSPDGN